MASIDQICSFLTALHSNVSSPEARKAAHQALENFKTSLAETCAREINASAIPTALNFVFSAIQHAQHQRLVQQQQAPANSSTDLPVYALLTHFALHVLDEILLQKHWMALPPDLQHKVRDLLWNGCFDVSSTTTTTTMNGTGATDSARSIGGTRRRGNSSGVEGAGAQGERGGGGGGGGGTASDRFVQVKWSSTLAAVAIREWPQRWPTLIEELVAVVAASQVNHVKVCEVLTTMSQDIYEFNDSITGERRAELSHALVLCLAQILNVLCNIIQTNYDSMHQHVLHVALSTLDSFLGWIPLSACFQCNLITACVQLITIDQQLSETSFSCLEKICGRKDTGAKDLGNNYKDQVFPVLTQMVNSILKVPIPHGRAGVMSQNFPGVDEDDYNVLKRTASLLAVLGIVHIEESFGWTSYDALHASSSPPQDSAAPHDSANIKTNKIEALISNRDRAILEAYLDIMIELVAHPSLAVGASALSFWNTFFRTSLATFADSKYAFLFFQRSIFRLFRIGYPDQDDHISCAYSALDFESQEDFLQTYNDSMGRTSSTCRLAASLTLALSCRFTLEQLSRLAEFIRSARGDPNQRIGFGFSSNNSWEFIPYNQSLISNYFAVEWISSKHALDAINALLGCVVSQGLSTSSQDIDPSIISMHEQMLAVILMFDLKSFPEFVLSIKAGALSSFIDLYERNEMTLLKVLEVLFDQVAYGLTSQSQYIATGNLELDFKNRACVAVAHISTKMKPEKIVIQLQGLTSKISSLIASGGLTSIEQCSLCDALAAASNGLQNIDEQASFLESILGGHLEILSSQIYTQALTSLENFLKLCHMNTSDVVPLDDTCNTLRNSIITVAVVCQRVKTYDPDGTRRVNALSRKVYNILLPLSINLMKILQTMYLPEVLNSFEKIGKRKYLNITPREIAHLMNLQSPLAAYGLGALNDVLAQHGIPLTDNICADYQIWLKELRHNIYHIMRSAISGGFITEESILLAILESCLLHHKNLILMHVIYFIRIVIKTIFTPKTINSEVLACALARPNFVSFLAHLCTLQNEGNEFIKETSRGNESSTEPCYTSVLQEQQYRLLTRAIGEIFSAMIPIFTTAQNQKGEKDQEIYQNFYPLFKDSELAKNTLFLLQSGIVVSDQRASVHISSLINQLIPIISKIDHLRPFLSLSLIPAILSSLANPLIYQSHENVVTLLISVIMTCPEDSYKSLCQLLISDKIKEDDIKTLVIGILNDTRKKSNRKLIKDFLNFRVNLSIGQPIGSKHETKVWALPEKLIIFKGTNPGDNEDFLESFCLFDNAIS